ncbi:MAG: MFS transporter [Gammaproteobacteria bacterium]|nr:MFS transporter [Gammaproteobacteria bacterium]
MWLIFTLAIVTYLDRLCISAAMPAIGEDFGLTAVQKGWVFSAFTFAYAAFEIPSGWLGDRFGARAALARIVTWWSAFTMLTGAVVGYWSLVIVRFLFGAGEAGAFPNIAKAVAQKMPAAMQGRALSVSFLGLALGAALSPLLVFPLVAWQGWRVTFVLFGLMGLVWCWVWLSVYREPERAAPSPVARRRINWWRLFTHRNLICIGCMYFAFAYGLYFYITWLPTYLLEARGFSVDLAKWLTALPWAFSAVGFWTGGWLTDRIAARSGNLRAARCWLGASGYTLSALTLLLVAQVQSDVAAALLLGVALSFQTVTIAAAWSVCLDVGRSHAGVVSGFMNTVGNIGGAICPLVVGYAVDKLHSWTMPFYAMAGIFVIGAVLWLRVDPYEQLLIEQ